MTNWWTVSAVVTELIGAGLIARGLALERANEWVRGRGSPRWGFSADADLNYASNSADAAVGFGALAVGILLQGIGALDTTAKGTTLLLVIPGLVLIIAWLSARELTLRRQRDVIQSRIQDLVVDRRWSEPDWQTIVHSYARALDQTNQGQHREAEDPWAQLNRIYGEGAWLPAGAAEGMRLSYEKNVSITHLDELGDLWLPWFVKADNPKDVVSHLNRSNARQLRVRDVVDDPAFHDALEVEYEHEGQPWTHLSRIDEYKEQWADLTGVSQGRFPAWRTPDGPVLQDGCHRACGIYALNPPDWRIDLELEHPPADHPDTQAGPRDAALGRTPN